MAEESSPYTSPLSQKPLTKDPSSTMDPILDNPQHEVSGVFKEVSAACNEVSCIQLVESDGGSENLRGFNEVSGDYNNVSEIKFVKNDEMFEGFSDKDGIPGIVLNNDDVGFEKKVKIDEFLELKDEVGVIGRSNSSEVGQSGFSESPSNGTSHELNSSKSEIWDEIAKNGDVVPYSLTMELIDEGVGVDISDKVGKKSRIRSKKGISNSVGIADSLNGARRKLKYSRKELEKLKFVNVKSQKKFWQKVYNGFDDNVRKEYVELGSFRQNSNHQAARKRNHGYQGNLGDSTSEDVVDVETRNSTDVNFDGESSGKYGEDMEWSEDEKSDDEYQSIQRPAFRVEGEPDFESGPPEDGFEYLRRVRWEAAHIPKVKVVKFDDSKITEQSVYMPQIPDIEKCPLHLAPLRQWEDGFVADFSALRLALTTLRDTSDAISVDSDTTICCRPGCTKRNSKNAVSLELPSGGPTISTLLAMDPVTRASLLNRRISLFESASNSSKDDYVWLFALCAVVETPLDGDTSASLRCLLRRCAKLLAEKDVFDDEVVMLNILVTIAGKFFRQSEN